MGQSVVSYTLFHLPTGGSWRSDNRGNISTYARYLPTLVRAHHALWEGWEMRLHHDEEAKRSAYFPSLRKMAERGLLRLVDCGRASSIGLSMLWRLLPVFDGGDRIVVSFDVDSLPILNMRMCVEEFLRSSRTLLVVHACESHNIVGGGMLAVRSKKFRDKVGASSFQDFLRVGGERDWGHYGTDERFLREIVWPKVSHDAMLIRLSGIDKPSQILCNDVRATWDVAMPEELRADVCEMGNAFCPYIGAAGYDIERALDYYSSVDLPAIRSIAECEDVSPREISFP